MARRTTMKAQDTLMDAERCGMHTRQLLRAMIAACPGGGERSTKHETHQTGLWDKNVPRPPHMIAACPGGGEGRHTTRHIRLGPGTHVPRPSLFRVSLLHVEG